MVDRSATA